MGQQWRGSGDWAFGLPRVIGDVPAGGEMLPPPHPIVTPLMDLGASADLRSRISGGHSHSLEAMRCAE